MEKKSEAGRPAPDFLPVFYCRYTVTLVWLAVAPKKDRQRLGAGTGACRNNGVDLENARIQCQELRRNPGGIVAGWPPTSTPVGAMIGVFVVGRDRTIGDVELLSLPSPVA